MAVKRLYLLLSVGAAALLSACTLPPRDAGASNKQARVKPELTAFYGAVAENSAIGYRAFLKSYPSGKYSDIALDLLKGCVTSACASDEQLQLALRSAVSISRGQTPKIAARGKQPSTLTRKAAQKTKRKTATSKVPAKPRETPRKVVATKSIY